MTNAALYRCKLLFLKNKFFRDISKTLQMSFELIFIFENYSFGLYFDNEQTENKMKKKFNMINVVALSALFLSNYASALNILLTNDDGWDTTNTQTLFTKLNTAGHNVILSAPCTGQSGKGGAVNFLKEVPVDTSKSDEKMYCVGETDSALAFEDFIEGTPVMSTMYGLDILALSAWGQAPDLVISGPNEGHNLGYLTNHSGTVGNINFALSRGIPAIAVSASHKDTKDVHAGLVADVVVEIVAELVKQKKEGEPLLPIFTGLNVNTPEDMVNHAGYLFTKVGWNPGEYTGKFTSDLSTERYSMEFVGRRLINAHPSFANATLEQAADYAVSLFAGKQGVALSDDVVTPDNSDSSEGIAISTNHITISTVDASLQATKAKEALTHLKLNALMQ